MPKESDTIAALASGTPPAGVSIIRISGRQFFSQISSLFQNDPSQWQEREAIYTAVLNSKGEILDRILGLKFVAPRSFTGEDVIEIHCHGGSYIIQSILKHLYDAGLRPADPGEFTKRAFLNGKLDLSAAEGIHELVSAQSHQQWEAARYLAQGGLKTRIEAIRGTMLDALALFEARIDFPDEGDTAEVGLDQAMVKVAEVKKRIQQLLSSYRSGKVAGEGMRVVFVGAPNTGKSTLLNALIGEERSIVTEIEGTTRDYIEVPCLIQGRLCRIFDTAGVRQTSDKVEKIGVERTLTLAQEADLVVHLTCADVESIEFDPGIYPKVLTVATKSDLHQAQRDADLAVSAKLDHGMEGLRSALARVCDEYTAPLKEAAFITNTRQKSFLEAALRGIGAAQQAKADGNYDEMIAFELQQAVREISGIIGEVTADDVLDNIFSNFCVGK